MKCGNCKTEMSDNTEKFDSTEKHLMGPGWTHLICKNEKCSDSGNGKHVRTGDMAKQELMEKTKSNKIKGAKVIPGQPLPAEAEQKLLEIKNIEDAIDALIAYADTVLENEEYVTTLRKIEKQNEKLEEIKERIGINANDKEIRDLMDERNAAIATFGPSLAMDLWGPDAFTKGKKDAVASADGKIVLLRSKRTDRTIIPAKFIENFPLVINQMIEGEEGKPPQIKITLKAAELYLGKEDIERVCDKKTTYSYELQIKDGRDIPCQQK